MAIRGTRVASVAGAVEAGTGSTLAGAGAAASSSSDLLLKDTV